MKIEDLLGPSTVLVKNLSVIVPPKDKNSLDDQLGVVPADDLGSADKDVVNPGIEYGDDGKAKWSPPLQQELSVIKGSVGTTTDDPTVEPTEYEKDALVAARNNTGANSNSAVAAAINAIREKNAAENQEIDVLGRNQDIDILARLKELAAIAVQKSNPSPTNKVATFLTRNFPSG